MVTSVVESWKMSFCRRLIAAAGTIITFAAYAIGLIPRPQQRKARWGRVYVSAATSSGPQAASGTSASRRVVANTRRPRCTYRLPRMGPAHRLLAADGNTIAAIFFRVGFSIV